MKVSGVYNVMCTVNKKMKMLKLHLNVYNMKKPSITINVLCPIMRKPVHTVGEGSVQ